MKLTKKIREASNLIKEIEQEIETMQNYFIMNNKKYYVKKSNLYDSNDSTISIGQIDRKGRISIFEGKTRKKTFVLKNKSKKLNENEINNNETNNDEEINSNITSSIIESNNNTINQNIVNEKLYENTENKNQTNFVNNYKNSQNSKSNNQAFKITLNNNIKKNNLNEPNSPDFRYTESIKSNNIVLNLNEPPNKSIKEEHNQDNFGYSGVDKNEVNEIGEFELR
jgi:hypothetical protein